VTTAEPTTERLTYRPELDGVRAIAVLAVLGFHTSLVAVPVRHLFRGGLIGVDIFFVLSGMLITELLVHEHRAHGSISLRGFYRRRSQRLLPVLAVFVVVSIIYFWLAHSEGRETLNSYPSIASYVTFGHVTAPENAEVGQVWTLVVEWEFYLIWPAILAALLYRGVALQKIAVGVATVACALTASRALAYHWNGHDYFLNYYLAVWRFDQLLIGCAVGLLGASPRVPWWLRTLGLVDLLVIITRTGLLDRWLAYGGTLAIAIAAAYVVQPRTTPWWFDSFLSSRPMVWIGKLSYSLYLWSGLAFGEVTRHTLTSSTWVRVALILVTSFAAAIASYYLIERPFRLPSRAPLTAEP
jgi:peptidoglycan/LPS O-acetylase OafA/YrhL